MADAGLAFGPPPPTTVGIQGSRQRFPVRRVYCVGRNYAEHAREMGHSGREAPFFFLKPADTVLAVDEGTQGGMRYPGLTDDLHHEVELVVAIGKGGSHITVADAPAHIWGYAVGLDMTRRDLQAEAKKLSRPWCAAKGFEESAPMGSLRRAAACVLGSGTAIRLRVNGELRQSGTLGAMIWNVEEIISYLSTVWDLQPGDLIFTGTPAGVGAVRDGDLMHAEVEGVGSLEVRVG